MNALTNIQNADFSFSENTEIAIAQAQTIQHALTLSSRIVTDPVYNSTKQLEIRTKAQVEFNTGLFNIFGILILVFCFVFLISFASKIPITVQPTRTVETGDMETTNKILQRELMLTKSDLDILKRENEMLQREFKNLRDKE